MSKNSCVSIKLNTKGLCYHVEFVEVRLGLQRSKNCDQQPGDPWESTRKQVGSEYTNIYPRRTVYTGMISARCADTVSITRLPSMNISQRFPNLLLNIVLRLITKRQLPVTSA